MQEIPDTIFHYRIDDNWVDRSVTDLFQGKRAVVFSLPGAFTTICSTKQLPSFEEAYDEFISLGIDEVYCISVNDSFVMNAWFKDQGIKKVKAIPDGNTFFTGQMNQLVLKNNLGFGFRSWRYAMVVNDTIIEQLWEEPGKIDDAEDDPYTTTDPQTVLSYLKENDT